MSWISRTPAALSHVTLSQPILTFEWTDSDGGCSGPLAWTRLPHGVKNSPTLSDDALRRDPLTSGGNTPRDPPSVCDALLLARSLSRNADTPLRLSRESWDDRSPGCVKESPALHSPATCLGCNVQGAERPLLSGLEASSGGPPDYREAGERIPVRRVLSPPGPRFAETAKPAYTSSGGTEPQLTRPDTDQSSSGTQTGAHLGARLSPA